jgi:hypothetical protein
MIIWSQFLSSEPSTFMSNSSSMDVNFSPDNILAVSGLNGLSTFDRELVPPIVGGFDIAVHSGPHRSLSLAETFDREEAQCHCPRKQIRRF